MKKIFLFTAGVALTLSSSAQRLSLYEEFSGENCGPCAAANPKLWSLVTTPGNESKILLIKYQSPIPSAGPIYWKTHSTYMIELYIMMCRLPLTVV